MKKFKFRLEPILKIREHAEKECQKNLAADIHEVNKQKIAIESIDVDRNNTVSSHRKSLLSQLSASSLLLHSRYLLRLKGETLSGKEILRALEGKATESRALLAEASKKKKIFEKLKERQSEKYTSELERLSNLELDEIAIMSHRRKTSI